MSQLAAQSFKAQPAQHMRSDGFELVDELVSVLPADHWIRVQSSQYAELMIGNIRTQYRRSPN